MVRGCALVVVAVFGLAEAAPRRADAKPTRLTMRSVDATNIHLANQAGAINTRTDVTITVVLRDKGKAEAVSVGSHRDHNLYADGAGSYTTQDVSTWTTRWAGAWSIRGGVLGLDLTLDAHACKHVYTSSGAPPETRPCRVASKRARYTCTSESVALDGAATRKRANRVAAWACALADGDSVAESPSRWVLGKTACLQVSGGRRGGIHYGACATAP